MNYETKRRNEEAGKVDGCTYEDIDSYNNITIMAGSTYSAELRSAQRTHVAKTYYECVSRITWEGMRRRDRWQRVHKGDGSRTNDKGEGEGGGVGGGVGGGDVTHVLATRG